MIQTTICFVFLGLSSPPHRSYESSSPPAPSSVLGNPDPLCRNTTEEAGNGAQWVKTLATQAWGPEFGTSTLVKIQRWPHGHI